VMTCEDRRLPPPPAQPSWVEKVSAMGLNTVAALKKYCAEQKVTVQGRKRKQEFVDAVAQHLQANAESSRAMAGATGSAVHGPAGSSSAAADSVKGAVSPMDTSGAADSGSRSLDADNGPGAMDTMPSVTAPARRSRRRDGSGNAWVKGKRLKKDSGDSGAT